MHFFRSSSHLPLFASTNYCFSFLSHAIASNYPDERDMRTITLKFVKSTSPDKLKAKSDITLSFLRDLAIDSFPECIQKSFSIGHKPAKPAKSAGDSSILSFATDQELAFFLDSAGANITFWVASECKGFREFNLLNAVLYARSTDNVPVVDDTEFPSEDFTDSDTAIKGILDHAVQDIMFKIPIFGPITDAQSEASVREFIGPLLVAAAKIAGEIKLVCEKRITGSKGAGPVDYAALYKTFNVVITEAKKDDLRSGLGQNIAQLVSAREDYLYRTAQPNNKRMFAEFAPDIASVPSFGAVSTAEKWVFTLYRGDRLYRSTPRLLLLEDGSSEADVRKGLLDVVGTLVGILNAQKVAIDENEYTRHEGPVRRIE